MEEIFHELSRVIRPYAPDRQQVHEGETCLRLLQPAGEAARVEQRAEGVHVVLPVLAHHPEWVDALTARLREHLVEPDCFVFEWVDLSLLHEMRGLARKALGSLTT